VDMQDFLLPIAEAFRDAAVGHADEVVGAIVFGVLGLIAAAVAFARRMLDQAKLKIAAAAGVKVAAVKTEAAMDLDGPALKLIADETTKALLAGASKKVIAKVGDAVQSAWEDGKKSRSSAPTVPETPSAKRGT